MTVVIRSRIGNVALAFAGLFFSLSGSALLVWYVITNWGANGLIDYLLQFALVMTLVVGLGFIRIGLANLKR